MSTAAGYSEDGFINASVQTSLTDIWQEEPVYQQYQEPTTAYNRTNSWRENRNSSYNSRPRERFNDGQRGRFNDGQRGRFNDGQRGRFNDGHRGRGRFHEDTQEQDSRGGFHEDQGQETRGENRFRGGFHEDQGQEARGENRFRGGSQNWRQKSDFNDKPSDSEKIKVVIPSLYVGRIIGKRGAKIKELQEESGARLHISHNEDDGPEAEIEVSGPPEAQIRAKELIEDFINYLDNPRQEGSRSTMSTHSWNSESSRRDNPSTYSLQSDSSESFNRRDKDNTFQNFDSSQNFNNSSYNNSQNYSNADSSYQKVDWTALLNQSEEETKRKWAKLPPLQKMFYFEDPVIANMHPIKVNDFRKQNNNIVVDHLSSSDDRPIPNPVFTFEQAFKNYPLIMREINKQGFDRPSPIQAQSWPILLQGYDMIGIAQTGTGKTLAFLLPALIHIDNQVVPRSERPGPTCLVMAPTRELAQQIERETKKYDYKGIKCVCLYGGGSRKDQISVVTKGVEIVVATPGRLNDLVMNKIMDVTSVSYLVLDEADRMLDMGFEPQIKKILLDIRPERQTVMTSATWPEGVREMAEKYMNKPMQVFVGTLDLAAVHSVTQKIIMSSEEEKRDQVYNFISAMGPDDKVIIFVDKKVIADDLASDFALNGIDCQSLHGNRDQSDREQALRDLESGEVRILVATDVASRGLDIKDITHIFNYGFPRNIEEYVHRVGRTGRAGQTGESITLVTREDWKHAQPLINILEEAEQEVPQELYEMAERFTSWKERKDAEDAVYGRKRGFGRRRF